MSSPNRHRRILRDSIHGISAPSLKRISLRTGHVRSQSRSTVSTIKNKIKTFLEGVIHDAVVIMVHAREKTVSVKAVEMALERRSKLFTKKILGSPPSKRCESYASHIKKGRRSKSRGSAAGGVERPRKRLSRAVSLQRRIRFYQNRHDCLHLPKLAMSRLIREIGQDFANDLRWSSKATNLLHYATELYVEAVFHTLGLLSIHRGGKGALHEKDYIALEAIEKLLEKGH